MEIVKKTEVQIMVRARLDDAGNFSIAVAGAAPYREGVTATAALEENDLPREKVQQVRAAMKALLDACGQEAGEASLKAAAQAEEVQKRMELAAG